MVIDGKLIAETIIQTLSKQVEILHSKSIHPTLAVILVGNDPGSLSYIKQKQKTGEKIGIRVLFEHLSDTVSPEVLESAIEHYNADATVHGVIIQRPVPTFIGETGNILNRVAPVKDVDGFLDHSPFQVPVAKAVINILENVHAKLTEQQLSTTGFLTWLRGQQIAVIGRGETAGKPIADLLRSFLCTPSIIHSQTTDPIELSRQASIVISCVGKPNTITRQRITRGVILISVGISRDKDGKLHGDYEQDDINQIASFYTPTPGGVGPVNVASLMQNVVEACILQEK